jgi:ferric-dicitrate binding protein FerR (iron transport regulator)
MESQNLLPENDQDLLLAKKLDSVLQMGEGVSSIQDPLIQSLLSYRNEEHSIIDSLKTESSEIWDRVLSETQTPKKAKVTPLRTRRNYVWAWATAATVLIASFLGMFWFTNLDNTVLIAQSGNDIQTITLADGSEVSLRPHTSLYQVELSETKRAYEIDGEAFFIVAKDVKKPFSVSSEHGVITVLGTQFNVSTWGDETNVFLEEGSVKINDLNQNSLILKPGERATISGNMLSNATQADLDEYKDWLNNVIVLKGTPVSQVIDELEHHYQASIDISAMDNTSELISGTIPLEDLNVTLKDLGIILGGTFREVNSNRFTFIPLN